MSKSKEHERNLHSRDSLGWVVVSLLADGVAAFLTVSVLIRIQSYLDGQHRQRLMQPTSIPTLPSFTPEATSNPTSQFVTATPLDTATPTLDLSPIWDCGFVNNPNNLDGYNSNLPDAPTASHVLALPGIGKSGVDNPPYLLNGRLVSQLSDLSLVRNEDEICALQP